MSTSKDVNELFDSIARILLRCAVLGFLLLLFWGVCYVLLLGPIHPEGKQFGLTPHETDLVHFCGMAFVKMCVLLFFLFPYIAIRLVLRRKVA